MLKSKSFIILRPAILGLSMLFVLGLTTPAFAQVGGATVKANFGVDADVYADTTQFDGLGVGIGTDDWFDRKAGVSFPGLGVIDTTGGGAFRALLQAAGDVLGRNKTFVKRMPYPFDTVVNGRRWIDAVYARDHIAVAAALDTTVFLGSNKNGDNPRTWGLGIDGTPQKNDLVDTWAHLRRDSALTTDSLWFFAGATTISSDGNAHFDCELFQNTVELNGTALTGLGPDSGHTAWQASGGEITVPGDIILSIDFTNGGATPLASLRLWVKLGPTATGTPYDTAAIAAALGLNFTGVVSSGLEASPFAYAEVVIPPGSIFARVNGIATDVAKSTLGAPWGSLEGSQGDFQDSILELQLAEVGINLSRWGLDVSDGNPCISMFGTIMFKTRSSAEFTASLKDFVGPFTFRAIVQIDLSLSKTDVTCYGYDDGTVTAIVSGGTPPYQARIDSGMWVNPPFIFTDLAPGLHIVDVQDVNNCQKTDSINVWEPPELVLDLDSTDVTCYGYDDGTITANFSGGTPGYMININGGDFEPATSPHLFPDLAAGSYTVVVKDVNECSNTASIDVGEPPELVLDLDSTDVTCYGYDDGTVTATVSGGTPPYQARIDSGMWVDPPFIFTDLDSGLHIVDVQDTNGCQVTGGINVWEPPELVLDLDSTDVTCLGYDDGTITATFSGGTPPDSIRIDGGAWIPATSPHTFTDLAPVSHTVDLKDAKDCLKSESITVDAPEVVVLDLDSTDVTCYGYDDGTVTATFSGGIEPYRIRIDGGDWVDPATSPHIFSGLVAGSHTVDLEDDNGCQETDSITVIAPEVVVLDLDSTDVTCFGYDDGTVTATFSGGIEPYRIRIDGGDWVDPATSPHIFSGLAAGSHTVDLEDDNGCQETDSITVIAPEVVVLDLDSTDVTCYGYDDGTVTAIVSGGTPPYQARIDSGVWVDPTTPPDTFIFTDLAPGLHIVDVQDVNNCQETDSTTVIAPEVVVLDLDSTDVTCFGYDDGTVTAIVSGGTPPYQARIDSGVWVDPTTPPDTFIFTDLAPGLHIVDVQDVNNCQETDSTTVIAPEVVVLALDSTDVTCFGYDDGTVAATVSGGTPPYQARIDSGVWVDPTTPPDTFIFTDLAPGPHIVDVQDAKGCQVTGGINVWEPPELILALDSTDVTCFGYDDGTVTAIVSGGTPPYQVRIDSGVWVDPTTPPDTFIFTDLAPGPHIVDVQDANNCLKSESINVAQPTELSCGISPSHATIPVGGTTTFTDNSTGGTLPYTYCWEKEPYDSGCISTSDTLTITSATFADAGQYRVIVTDDNGCADTCYCELTVTGECCPSVWIGTVDCVNPGEHVGVPIILECTPAFGGFELEVEFDYTSMTFVGAERGRLIPEGTFEKFTYRLLPCPACGCCKYKILLFGMYDLPNAHVGVPIPEVPEKDTLVILNFVVNSDENLRGLMIPICWEWEGDIDPETGCLVEDWNCGENTFSSVTGDTLFTSVLCCQFEGSLCDDPNAGIEPELYFQPDTNCVSDCYRICGGIVVCPAGPGECKRGDVNYNTLTYEVADAVLFASYFVEGTSVFVHDEAYQICATDVNADGRALTLSDLVYLIRVILHDAAAIPDGKLTPSSEVANVVVFNGTISTECAAPIGAILFEFDGAVQPTLLADMEMVNKDNKVLVWSSKGKSIATGEVLSFEGKAELVTATAVDRDSRELTTTITVKVAPTAFALNPAYPNPFNPLTNLSFTLPEAMDYSLRIYNVTGQLVRRFEGVGSQNLNVIIWDGRDNRGDEVSSGVYFYRLTAAGFSATQKMVMMK